MGSPMLKIGVAGVLALTAAAAPAEASSTVEIAHRTLVVRGGAEADVIALEASRRVLRVDVGDDGSVEFEVNRSRFDRIRVETAGGADEVHVEPGRHDLEPVDIDGGDGFDQFIAEGSDAGERYEISARDGVVRVSEDRGRLRATADVEGVETFGGGGSDTTDIDDLTGAELQSLVVELGTVRGFETADGANDRITVEATDGSDHIVAFGLSDFMSVFGTPETLSIANPDPSDRLTIDGRSGDDAISLHSDALTHTVRGGDGNDTVFGSPGEDVLVGGDGDDEVIGSEGDDVAYLGDDADRFVWEPGSGDDVVEGGSGDDAIELIGADVPERFDLTAHGRRLSVARDVDGADIDVDDVEKVATEALGGADTITVGDLRRTDVEAVHPALAAALDVDDPDGAADRVVVTGTERKDRIAVTGEGRSVAVAGLAALVDITEAEPLDTLAIRTGGGDDGVDSSGLAPGVIGLDVE